MRTTLVIASLLVGFAIAPTHVTAETSKPAPGAIGTAVKDFSLYDVQRRLRSLGEFTDIKACVVVFVGTECPVANVYLPRLAKLQGEYAEKKVQFIAINSNPQDSFLRVSGHAQEREIPFPVFKDFDQKVAKDFGVKVTPEAYLLDAKFVIRYRGRIDDQYTVTHRRVAPKQHDLRMALDQLLAGKPVSAPATVATGCSITYLKSPRISKEITYTKHVSRILQDRCQECHRPGQVGPFALMSYDDAKRRSRMIHDVVLEQRMPPWHADPHYGEFSNDRQLTGDERDQLLAWIEQDCPKGDAKDLPSPRSYPQGWTIGTPDLVVEMPVEESVPADGVIDYRYYDVDPGFTEDVWIQAAEARPGNYEVVHHIIAYISSPGTPIFSKEGETAILVGWAPGDMPAIYPEGVARKIPAGSKLKFEVHYTTNGKAATDRSSVGIIFARKPPKREARTNILWKRRLQIPPHESSHHQTASFTFPADAKILSFMPHMHLRGVRALYEIKHPGGRKETLLSVPAYDFNWQSIYRYAEPIAAPKGATVTFTGWWDNSEENPANPDPTRTVPWGEQTWDEMLNGWVEFVYAEPGDDKQ